MNKIAIKFEYHGMNDEELKEYLLSIKGIKNVYVDSQDDEKIHIEYDNNTCIKIIINEIKLFSNIKFPSISYFSKNAKENISSSELLIQDLCCEYCLYGFIENLLNNNAIVEAYSNYDYSNKNNVKIFIKYKNNLINEEKLKDIEKEFNM